MVNHSIKVYARLKREDNCGEKGSYEIVQRKARFDDIIFYTQSIQQGNYPSSFRFHKVFDQYCNQEDIFDAIAKPVINSVLQGINGTIFAYGQTGSGKTYTITGSPKNYNDRGIIPRSIQYIFAENEKLSTKPTIYISYMEIYNEVGYDLLSPKQNNTARSLEDLPRIALLEDGKGEAHIRNLSVLPVTTEQEAMRLLFLGDTNRTIAETPMNEYSSRSHCIFTIYITFRNEPTNVIRFSKLHLVDLAGSERVSKSLSTGMALNEAKHINLSLHYLQQVILALSESKRSHIPYRNSMMTYLLKDSLSGNCLTAMLATLSASKSNIQETLSTCKFAQRVSLISTEPVINEICDPHQEIVFLKNKIEELRKQISVLTGFTASSILSKNEEELCKKEVEKYLITENSNDELRVKSDLRQIQFCFKLLKKKINSQSRESQEHKLKYDKSQKELNVLKEAVDKKEAEITTLRTIIDNIPEHPVNPNKSSYRINNFETPEAVTIQTSNDNVIRNSCQDANTAISFETCFPNIDQEDEKQLFDKFMMISDNSKDLNYYSKNLEKKWEMAKIYADTIEQCQKNIIYVRQKLQICSDNAEKNQLLQELEEHQNIYRKSLADLKTVKNETDHLQSGLKQAEIRTIQKFKIWWNEQKSQRNRSMVNEICWSEPSRKPCECKDGSQGCCKKKCACRNKMDSSPILNCTSLYCHPDDFCTDCNRASSSFSHHMVQDHLRRRNDSCGCRDSAFQEVKPHIHRNDPYLYHPAHSELNCINYDLLKRPDIFRKPRETTGFQKEDPPAMKGQSCRNIISDLTFGCSSDLLDNINILINKVDDDKAYCLNKRENCQHDANKNNTKVCCQLFCCNNLNRGKVLLTKNRPKYPTACEYRVLRENQLCCEHEERIPVPNIQLPDCEHIVEDDQELCEAFCTTNSCEEVRFVAENTNSDHAAVKEDCNDCHIQTQEASDVENRVEVIAEAKTSNGNYSTLFKQSDSAEFREFMKTVPLTGEPDIDEEICSFYRNKFCA